MSHVPRCWCDVWRMLLERAPHETYLSLLDHHVCYDRCSRYRRPVSTAIERFVKSCRGVGWVRLGLLRVAMRECTGPSNAMLLRLSRGRRPSNDTRLRSQEGDKKTSWDWRFFSRQNSCAATGRSPATEELIGNWVGLRGWCTRRQPPYVTHHEPQLFRPIPSRTRHEWRLFS